MPKLTDTQLMLLSNAAQMGGLIFLPLKLKGAAAAKVVKPLLQNGLIKEVLSQPDAGAWRRDEATGEYYGLLITDAGRAAINAEENAKPEGTPGTTPPAPKSPRARKAARSKATKQRAAQQEASDGSPRPRSKLAKVITMLSSKGGTTIDAIVKATDWLPHTTRAALTGLRKRGYQIEKESPEGGRTVYRIVGRVQARKSSAKKSRKRR